MLAADMVRERTHQILEAVGKNAMRPCPHQHPRTESGITKPAASSPRSAHYRPNGGIVADRIPSTAPSLKFRVVG